MRRGFLNTPRAKRMINEVYAPQSPPGPGLSPQESPSPHGTQDRGGEEVVAAEDGMDVETGDLSSAETRATEDEAELPSLDDNNGAKAKPPSQDLKGKSKEIPMEMRDNPSFEDIVASGFIPPRPLPRRPGWGRDPEEDFFHTVPRSHGGPDVKRAIFRLWPRDPNGKPIMPSEQPKGTLSPDGYPWGATLYDLYSVRRIPSISNFTTMMTGSAIMEAVQELGELDAAAAEIEWTKTEGKPRVEGVANTGMLIERAEQRVGLSAQKEQALEDDNGNDEDREEEDGKVSGHVDGAEDKSKIKHDDDMDVDSASIPPSTTIPITSPFHPSHYPKPWPFIPFENPLSILLQERIPLYLLPQTLYVHDPFNLLSAREKTFHRTSWSSRPDVIRTYSLNLTEAMRNEVKEARRKAEKLEEFRARTLIILRYKRTKEQIKNYEPVIEVPLPPYPRRMTKVEEGHLYISPATWVGRGNHSVIYKGEWELPRDLFTRPKICRKCFKESAEKEVQRLKHMGRWEKLLKAASWGPKGFTGRRPTKAELAEVNDPVNLETDGEIIEREIICIVPPDAHPSEIFKTVEEVDMWDVFRKQKNANTWIVNLVDPGNEDESLKIPDAPIIRINPPFSHESQTTCTHDPHRVATPRTARFTVVAKLSIEDDPHLAREAGNYQQFPEHFFHHYNGYTIISQLHAVVPVHAVVPQFYGYYTPEDKKKRQTGKEYLSPILLLEHCGMPIDPEKLSDADQDECASLFLRFQRAKWLHESIGSRNLLVQYGKPTESPLQREAKPEPSFRLIDFGRSRKYNTAEEKRAEELDVLRMFQNLRSKMSVTFSL